MAPSSSSSGSSSASRSGGSTPLAFIQKEPACPSTPVFVKKEPTSPPPTRERRSGALLIRDQPSCPQRGRKRKSSKKEAAAANQLAEEEAKRAEEVAVAEAIARSLSDLVPADNSLPMNAALEWSRRDWERQEAEQQRRMLDMATARQRIVRATAHSAATNAVPRTVELIKLEESSDDDIYRPTPPRAGDPNQGSSRWYEGAAPEDASSSSDDDDDDQLERQRRRRHGLHGLLPPFQHVEVRY